MDPVVHNSLRLALSLLLLIAALHKLRDLAAFGDAVNDYRLLPAALGGAIAVALVVAEIGIAAALPLVTSGAPAVAAAVLLAVYTAAMVINLARGRRDIDCGCAGPARRQAIGIGLVLRNVALCTAALLAAMAPSARALTWIDRVTIFATVAFLALAYTAIDALLANASRMRGSAASRGLRDPATADGAA